MKALYRGRWPLAPWVVLFISSFVLTGLGNWVWAPLKSVALVVTVVACLGALTASLLLATHRAGARPQAALGAIGSAAILAFCLYAAIARPEQAGLVALVAMAGSAALITGSIIPVGERTTPAP